MRPLRICLVAPGHISTTPRIVKEADALALAGHDVRVVALRRDPDNVRRDAGLLRGARWRLQTVDVCRDRPSSALRWLACSLAERAARLALAAGLRSDLVEEQAVGRYLVPFVRAIVSEPADLVIGRGLSGMAKALRGARALGARAGYDMEDFHSGELPPGPEHARERALRERLERRQLPRFALLTAASEGIADEMVRRYGVRRPRVILNAFSLADRLRTCPPEPRGERPSLYWFSQTIGRDRGLDDALRALAMMERPADLFLRGAIDAAYREELARRAEELGVADRLHLLPLAAPEQLVALAMQHDVGLALEQPVSLNKVLCTSNKLLLYLVAGIAVAATDTPGQRPILEAVPGAGFLYPPGDAAALARGLDALLESPLALRRAKAAALRAAEERFSWEVEQRAIVDHVTAGSSVAAELAGRS